MPNRIGAMNPQGITHHFEPRIVYIQTLKSQWIAFTTSKYGVYHYSAYMNSILLKEPTKTQAVLREFNDCVHISRFNIVPSHETQFETICGGRSDTARLLYLCINKNKARVGR